MSHWFPLIRGIARRSCTIPVPLLLPLRLSNYGRWRCNLANVFKLNKVWYVRFKDQSGHWKKKSCGRGATKSDANAIAQLKGALELNYRHKMPVRLIKTSLVEALTKYRDDIIHIPKSNLTTKQESSVRREKAVVKNFLAI